MAQGKEQLPEFPDQVHINTIRERLWSGGEFGRSAVMVGAGFSRNAGKVAENTPRFPLWRDLANMMQQSLYGSTDHLKDPMRLASEYEMASGRQSLDEFLLGSIQDEKYYPGKLHQLLLTLPWSDVFTTNYDTLLERAMPAIHEKRYDCVCTASDIPASTKPRIVKLHGSFPSHRPFIFTEEDYRTYPTKFAPFVNTVQQSIMENVFCLIGFSGDDPNFHYWTGWVRDHLGDSAPYIYLCGLLDPSPSQRQLYESRRIRLIDLSPLFPKRNYPDQDQRHSLATEWFLLNLLYGAPPDVQYWPNRPTDSTWKPSDGIPAIPPGPRVPAGPGPAWLAHSKPDTETLMHVCDHWARNRLEYPGWVVCPKSNREMVLHCTEPYAQHMISSCQELDPPDNLHMLYELNWRLERALSPLYDSWADAIARVVESYNPFPALLQMDTASSDPTEEKSSRLDWLSIRYQWVELAFALVRYAREEQNEQMFSMWVQRMESIVNLNTEWHARLLCERSLYHIIRMEKAELSQLLQAWPDCSALPFYEVRRAAILAESGCVTEANGIAEMALSKIRSSLRSDPVNYSLLSQEGWAMLLLRTLSVGAQEFRRPEVEQFRSRWGKLQAFRCNPWYEIESLGSAIQGHRTPTAYEKNVGFDPGLETVTQRLCRDEGPHLSVAMLRMLEDGAVPLRCGFTKAHDGVGSAAELLLQSYPAWSLSVLLRVDKAKGIDKVFGRSDIAALDEAQVERLYSFCVAPLSQALSSTSGTAGNQRDNGITEVALQCLPKLLSHLCLRLSSEKLQVIFELACKMYTHNVCRSDISLHTTLDNLFKRVLYAMSGSDALLSLPVLLALPVPDEGGFAVAYPMEWTEPTLHVNGLDAGSMPKHLDKSACAERIGILISLAKHGSKYARRAVCLRLHVLHEISALSQDQKRMFSEALWSFVDRESGLPAGTGLLDHAFLSMPQPKPGKAKPLLRKHLLASGFPFCVSHEQDEAGKDKMKFSDSSALGHRAQVWLHCTAGLPHWARINSKQLIDWSANEAETLLSNLAAWWTNDKAILRPDDPFFLLCDPRAEYRQMVELLAKIAIPRLVRADEAKKQDAMRLLIEMRDAGLDIVHISPLTLLIEPADFDPIASKIRDCLFSSDEALTHSSLSAIFNWFAFGVQPAPPPDLIDTCVWMVATRRQPGLKSAICNAARLIHYLPDLLREDHMGSLCAGLKYLVMDTKIPASRSEKTQDDISALIPVTHMPIYRRVSAELARELFLLYRRRRMPVPGIIEQWRDICKTDPLPEVRKAWPT